MERLLILEKRDGTEAGIVIPYSAREMIEQLWLDRHGVVYADLAPDAAKALRSEMWTCLNRAGLSGG